MLGGQQKGPSGYVHTENVCAMCQCSVHECMYAWNMYGVYMCECLCVYVCMLCVHMYIPVCTCASVYVCGVCMCVCISECAWCVYGICECVPLLTLCMLEHT